ncbi:MAG TPA: hypothetical protein VNJ54_12625 [Plantibacter sp.]|uniref:hypothetical protein n=1 Tax=Plantibacter sp. TaxID=1871045 RepID=UPI002C4C9C62|nr:hypothetical protein [Plantibacter sp.]
MKEAFLLAMERVRADLLEVIVAAQSDDLAAVESGLDRAVERMQAAVVAMDAAA